MTTDSMSLAGDRLAHPDNWRELKSQKTVHAYLGIDPGLGGAVACIYGDSVWVRDIPSVVVKGSRRDYLAGQFAQLIAPYRDRPATVTIETPIAMPRQASNTTMKQGLGYGLALGICAAYGLRVELVAPAKWKKLMAIPPGSDKGASRVLACQLFPALDGELARVRDDGRAEALLLAEVGRRLSGSSYE